MFLVEFIKNRSRPTWALSLIPPVSSAQIYQIAFRKQKLKVEAQFRVSLVYSCFCGIRIIL